MDLRQIDPAALTLSVQLGIVALISIFFFVLGRSVRLIEVRVWAWAWLAELLSVVCASAFILAGRPAPGLTARLLLTGFVICKSLYGVLLMQGTRLHFTPGAAQGIGSLRAGAVAWGLLVFIVAPPVTLVLGLQWAVVAALLCTSAVFAFRAPEGGRQRWLAWVLMGVGMLYVGYVVALAPSLFEGSQPSFLDYSSLLDAAADLLLALALLVAFESVQSKRLIDLNERLLQSNDRLLLLADSDPLTGLRNRRAARSYVQGIGEQETSVVFFDIDDFKDVNDKHGHAVGDASLVHSARVLVRAFRPDDGVFRWGGDEFVVVAPGLGRESASSRMAEVERSLAAGSRNLPGVSVSYGVASGRAFDAFANLLHKADEEMYLIKKRRDDGSVEMHTRDGDRH